MKGEAKGYLGKIPEQQKSELHPMHIGYSNIHSTYCMEASELDCSSIYSPPSCKRYFIWVGHTRPNTCFFLFGSATMGDGISVVCACMLMAERPKVIIIVYNLVMLYVIMPISTHIASSPWPHH